MNEIGVGWGRMLFRKSILEMLLVNSIPSHTPVHISISFPILTIFSFISIQTPFLAKKSKIPDQTKQKGEKKSQFAVFYFPPLPKFKTLILSLSLSKCSNYFSWLLKLLPKEYH